MRVAVDLDGVVYDWERTARFMLRKEARRRDLYIPELYAPSNRWDYITESIPIELNGWLWEEGVNQGLFRYGNVVTGAIDGVKILAKKHEVFFLTNRPINAHKDTQEWVKFMFDDIRVEFSDEYLKKRTFKWDVLVDDGPQNFIGLPLGRKGILFNAPWNEKSPTPKNVERVFGWDRLLAKIRHLTGGILNASRVQIVPKNPTSLSGDHHH